MRAILVNPYSPDNDQRVKAVNFDDTLDSIYKLIEAETFDIARLANGDAVFVDDTGLMNSSFMDMFLIEGYSYPLAGRGLILGTNLDTGESTEPELTVEQARAIIKFWPEFNPLNY